VVLGAPMPEASVDEDRNAESGKHDICRSAHRRDWPTIDEVSESSSMQLPSDRQLRSCVTTPIGAHRRPNCGTRRPRFSALRHAQMLVGTTSSACRPGRASVGAILVARYGGLSLA
jgi:hypothetical protein